MRRLALVLSLIATPALAESPGKRMFPSDASCYLRQYSKAHLAENPRQFVTQIAIGPVAAQWGDPQLLVLTLVVELRGSRDRFGGTAYCEAEGARLSCGMEGDAGSFHLEPAKNGAVKLTVSRAGVILEGHEPCQRIVVRGEHGDMLPGGLHLLQGMRGHAFAGSRCGAHAAKATCRPPDRFANGAGRSGRWDGQRQGRDLERRTVDRWSAIFGTAHFRLHPSIHATFRLRARHCHPSFSM
jgi:hypothetical protein